MSNWFTKLFSSPTKTENDMGCAIPWTDPRKNGMYSVEDRALPDEDLIAKYPFLKNNPFVGGGE